MASFYIESAKEFRKAYTLPPLKSPDGIRLQQSLISEEYAEFNQAASLAQKSYYNYKNREEMLKELADLMYVCFQMAAYMGWDIDEAFKRVHESNMSKLDDNGNPGRRDDGKILKGPNYKLPDLSDLV